MQQKPMLKASLTTEILKNQTTGLTNSDVEVNICTKDTNIDQLTLFINMSHSLVEEKRDPSLSNEGWKCLIGSRWFQQNP